MRRKVTDCARVFNKGIERLGLRVYDEFVNFKNPPPVAFDSEVRKLAGLKKANKTQLKFWKLLNN